MTAMGDYLENAIINHFLRNTSVATPASNVWVALYTTATTDTGGGTEVTGGSYARQRCQGTGGWDGPSNGATQNTGAITFPTATAGWGTVSHVGVRGGAAGSNLLYHGALTSPKTVNSGDTFRFSAGALDVVNA